MLRQWLRLLDPTLHQLQQDTGTTLPSRLAFARALNGRGLHEEARAVLDAALAEHPGDPDLWFERIMALGDHATADEMEDLSRRLAGIRAGLGASKAWLKNKTFTFKAVRQNNR